MENAKSVVRENLFLLAIIGVLAVGLRVPGFSRGFWLDEYSTVATINGWKPDWTVWHQNIPPFFYPIMQAWYRISAEESWLRVFPLIFGLLLPLATFYLLSGVSRGAALAGAGWVAVQPYLRIQSTELRTYSLFYAGCGIFWLAACRLPGGRRRPLWLALIAGAGLALLSHTLGLIAFGAGALVLLARLGWNPKRFLVFVLAGVAAAGALWAWWDFNLPARLPWVPKPQGRIVTFAFFEALGVFQQNPPLDPWPFRILELLPQLLAFLLVPIGVFLFYQAKKSSSAALALAGVVYLEGILVASLTFQPLVLARYLAPTALAWGLAFWVYWFEAGSRRAWLGTLLVVGIFPWLAVQRFAEANASKGSLLPVEREIAAQWKPGTAILGYPAMLIGNGVGRYYAHIPADHLFGVSRGYYDGTEKELKELWARHRIVGRPKTFLIVRGSFPTAVQQALESRFGKARQMSRGLVRWYRFE